MSSTTMYNSIVTMKQYFGTISSNNCPLYCSRKDEFYQLSEFMTDSNCSEVNIYDLAVWIKERYTKCCISFSDKVAFLTVLSLGTFSDDEIYHTFYLPSTADCMNAYKKIEKKLKRKQHITINFSLGNNHMPSNPYDIINYEITVDFFSANPICCKYWDTEGIQCVERY